MTYVWIVEFLVNRSLWRFQVSAFVVSREHISAMVDAGRRIPRGTNLTWFVAPIDRNADNYPPKRNELTDDNLNEVGQMLLDANVKSVNERYNRDELADTFTYLGRRGESLSALDILSMINCYEYQACEADDWHTSEAFQFCEALKHQVIKRLPGYEEAEYHYDGPQKGIEEARARLIANGSASASDFEKVGR